jgi:hypothetical protein
VFDGAFNDDGASASSSPIWMIAMVDNIIWDSKIAFVRKVIFLRLPNLEDRVPVFTCRQDTGWPSYTPRALG